MGENLHASDRLVIEGQQVPDDLLPLDHHAGGQIPALLRVFLPLDAARQAEVQSLISALPQEERRQPARMPSSYDLYARHEGPGPLVMRLLCNRNLNQLAVAKSIFHVSRSRRYWSASTYALVGSNRKELTPDLLGDLSILLNLPADEIERLTGITPAVRAVLHPDGRVWDVSRVADLIRDVRRLSCDQMRHVCEVVEAMD